MYFLSESHAFSRNLIHQPLSNRLLVTRLKAKIYKHRISKAGGGIPIIPSGGRDLFDPGEEGLMAGSSSFQARLKRGSKYQQASLNDSFRSYIAPINDEIFENDSIQVKDVDQKPEKEPEIVNEGPIQMNTNENLPSPVGKEQVIEEIGSMDQIVTKESVSEVQDDSLLEKEIISVIENEKRQQRPRSQYQQQNHHHYRAGIRGAPTNWWDNPSSISTLLSDDL
jgi:hypothetical protein